MRGAKTLIENNFPLAENKDIKRLFIVGSNRCLSILAHIPVPLANQHNCVTRFVSAWATPGGISNLLSAAHCRASLALVGLSPFITASIIIQLLTKIFQGFEELHKDGESGSSEIQQWTRVATVPVCYCPVDQAIFILRQTAFQAAVMTLADLTMMEGIVSITSMTAGSVLLMCLASW